MYFILLDYLISGQSRVKCSVASPGGEAQDIFFFFFNKRDIFPLDACPCDSMKSMKGKKSRKEKHKQKRALLSHHDLLSNHVLQICPEVLRGEDRGGSREGGRNFVTNTFVKLQFSHSRLLIHNGT